MSQPSLFNPEPTGEAVESFTSSRESLTRAISRRDGSTTRSSVPARDVLRGEEGSLAAAFDASWLSSTEVLGLPPSGAPTMRVADLFAGCGGLTLGLHEACRALGLAMEPVLAVDTDERALSVYEANFPGVESWKAPVEELIDGEVGNSPTLQEASLRKRVGPIDILVGGPPCQGHSDLNNHTRREDPRNELYLRMARFCEVFRPRHVVIENVPGVLNDRAHVAQRTWAALTKLGYSISTATVNAADLGVAQMRKRNITVASLVIHPDLIAMLSEMGQPRRSVLWTLQGMPAISSLPDVYNTAPEPKGETKERIDYLFDSNVYELPDELRPDCHRLKSHTYKSNYGRIYPDRPAQTITTGFGVMGKGRFVHPTERRTLTPHEAARIQFFPDFFQFPDIGRTQLQKLIGNAVPPKLGYALGVHLLR